MNDAGDLTTKYEQKKFYIKRTFMYVCGICFVLSLNHIISLFQLHGEADGVGKFGYNIWSLLGFIIALWLLNRMFHRTDKRLHCAGAAGGFLMAAAIVYGAYAHFVNDIFQSVQVVCLQFAVTAGLAVVLAAASEEVFLQFDRLNQYGQRKGEYKVTKRYFFVMLLFIFAAYLPIFLWFWPGNFVYDVPFQLEDVVLNQFNTHHPLLHTIIMGAAYKFGVSIGDASTGIQLYILLQMLILSAVFAYCAYYLYKRAVPKAYCRCALLWFALFPMHAMFSITATKDVMFAAFFLWFMIFVVRLLLDKEQFRWYSYAGLIISGALCCLMRNNAVYAVVAGAVLILLLVKRNHKQKLYGAGLLAAVYILASLVNTGFITALKAQTVDRYTETYCMMLQCLARVGAYRGDEVSETDYAELCMYMVEEDMKSYQPYLADNVKFSANEQLMKENFWNFLKFFVKMGLKFPDEYIEAWITNTMGYWYPLDRGKYVCGNIEFYHKLIYRDCEQIEKREYFSLPGIIYEPFYFRGKYDITPVLGYLHRNDFWIWLLTYFLLWCICRKKRDAGLAAVIPLMYLATCYLGPLAWLRYIYCLVVIAPLIGYAVMRASAANMTENQINKK